MFLFTFLLFVLWSQTATLPSSTAPVDSPTDTLPLTLQDPTFAAHRSTWSIIRTCFAVVFTCAWVTVHPNIPPAHYGTKQRFFRRLEYMASTIMGPELILLWAILQYLGARYILSKISKAHPKHVWTITHSHFLQMGGFVLYDTDDRPLGVITEAYEDDPRDSGVRGPATTLYLSVLLEKKLIDFPSITEKEILDKSKSDGLAKLIAIGQTAWFILQILARLVLNLAITQLELVTVALAALNAIMYFCWWNKPYNVQTQVPVKLLGAANKVKTELEDDPKESRNKIVPDVMGAILISLAAKPALLSAFKVISKPYNNFVDWSYEGYWGVGQPDPQHESHIKVPIFYTLIEPDPRIRVKVTLAVATTSVIFGGIHCAGWYSSFPSRPELLIWRISTALSASILFLIAVWSLSMIWLHHYAEKSQHYKPGFFFERLAKMSLKAVIIICIFFVLLRVLVLVVALLSLRDISESGHTAINWVAELPHI